jgi:hypothetical protein
LNNCGIVNISIFAILGAIGATGRRSQYQTGLHLFCPYSAVDSSIEYLTWMPHSGIAGLPDCWIAGLLDCWIVDYWIPGLLDCFLTLMFCLQSDAVCSWGTSDYCRLPSTILDHPASHCSWDASCLQMPRHSWTASSVVLHVFGPTDKMASGGEESVSQSINQSIDQSISQSTNVCMHRLDSSYTLEKSMWLECAGVGSGCLGTCTSGHIILYFLSNNPT